MSFWKHELYTSSALTCLTLAAAVLLPASVMANPTGGVVSAGQASVSEAGKTLTVDQSSTKAVIDWRGFDIGSDETTRFNQPGSNAITLNRINSGSPSQIMGTLSANGNIIVLNANGVVFGAGSQVDVNGLVATTAGISNEHFMAGDMRFDQAGNPNASIINNGTITAKDAGLVGLVAPNVVNNGVISAKLGRVQLASGDTATLDLYGDHLMEVAVSDDVKSQLVSNAGTIKADGGSIALTAAAGSKVVDSLITVSGSLQANAAMQKNGEIIIFAQGSHAVIDNVADNKGRKPGGSDVQVSGTLSARSRSGRGGDITVTGDHVLLLSGAAVDASGDIGGGTIKIGGDLHGEGATATALNTTVESGVNLYADALTSGNGGTIAVWADDTTHYSGMAYARGGSISGNGGFIETSGHASLVANGGVNLTAVNGEWGTYLLDPANITIYNRSKAGTDNTNTFTTSYLEGLSSSGNVSLTATSALTLDFTGDTMAFSTSGRTLTLSGATYSVASASTITTNNANIAFGGTAAMTLSNDLTLNAGTGTVSFNGTIDGAKNLSVTSGTTTFAGKIGNTTALNNLSLTTDNLTFTGTIVKGTGTLSIAPQTNNRDINMNNGASGLYLTTSQIGYIQSNWNAVNIGNSSNNGIITLGTATWKASTSFTEGSGGSIVISAAQTGGAAGTLSYTGATTLKSTVTTTNQAINFNSAVTLGATSSATAGTGTLTFSSTIDGAYGLTTSAGTSNFNGAIGATTSIGQLSVTTDNVSFGSTAKGTSSFTLAPLTLSRNININNGACDGTSLCVTTAQINNIQSGWTSVNFGTSGLTDTGTATVGAATWTNGVVRVRMNAAGSTNVVGAQSLSNGTTLNFLNSTGTLTFASGGTVNGTGGTLTISAGTTNFNDSVGASTPLSSLNITTDNLTFGNGVTATGSSNMRIYPLTLTRNININNGACDGTSLCLTTAMLGNIQNGWANQYIGDSSNADTGILTVGAATWNRATTFSMNSAGSTSVTGAQTANANLTYANSTGTLTFGAGGTIDGTNTITVTAGTANFNAALGATTALANLTVTSDNVSFASTVKGTTSLKLYPQTASRAINLATGVKDGSSYQLSASELTNLQNGWTLLYFGNPNYSSIGALTIGATTWSLPTKFSIGNAGSISVVGAQTVNSTVQYNIDSGVGGNLTFNSSATIDGTGLAYLRGQNVSFSAPVGSITPLATFCINADNVTIGSTLKGSSFQILPLTTSRDFNINNGTSGLYLTTADVTNIMNGGWTNLLFGSNNYYSGAMTVGAGTYSLGASFRSAGTINVIGAQTLGGSSSYVANTSVTFQAAGTVDGAYDIAVTGAAVTLNSAFGATTPLSNITVATDSLSISNTLKTSGTLTLNSYSSKTIGFGTAATGQGVNFTDAQFGYFSAPNLVFGSTTTGSGVASTNSITINTAYDFGDSNVSFISGYDLNLYGNLTRATGNGTVNYLLQANRSILNNTSSITGANGTGKINLTLDSDYDQATLPGGYIYIDGGSISTNGGNIVFGGGTSPTTQYAYISGGSTAGITVRGTKVDAGGGDITMLGQNAYVSAGSQYFFGVSISSSSSTGLSSQLLTTGKGNINLYGYGGAAGLSSNYGVRFYNSSASVQDGSIYAFGQGGAGGTGSNYGVSVEGSQLTSTGSGGITLEGIAGAGSVGISVRNSGTAIGGANDSGDITFLADDISLSNLPANPIQTTGVITVAPRTAVTMGVGPSSGSALNLDTASLAYLKGGSYVFGSATGGDLTINTTADLAKNITLRSGGTITLASALTDTGKSITFSGLTTLNDSITASGITFSNAVTLGANSVLNAGSGALNFASTLNGAYDFTATAGSFSFASAIGGTTRLGAVSLTSAGSVTLPAITATSVFAQTTGSTSDITLGGIINATGANTAVTLVSGENFFNSVGAGAIVTPNGRWLVYSTNPSADSDNNLAEDFHRYSCTYGGSCPSFLSSESGFLYKYTPHLSLTPNGGTITYGDAATAILSAYAGITGYLGTDGAHDSITGTYAGTTNYAQGNNVGSYDVTGGGNLASAMGYAIDYGTYTNGLVVGQRTLTVSLTGNVNKVYDGTRVATLDGSNYTLGNTVNSDDVGIATTSGLYDTMNAGSGKTVTVNGLTLNGSLASNYTLQSGSVSGSVGSIDQRTLTVLLTGSVNKVYDDTTFATLSGSNYRFVNLVSGNDVNVTNTSGFYDTKDVGTGKTVTVNSLVLGGAMASNYILLNNSVSANIGIINDGSPPPVVNTNISNGDIAIDVLNAIRPLMNNQGLGMVSDPAMGNMRLFQKDQNQKKQDTPFVSFSALAPSGHQPLSDEDALCKVSE